MMQQASQKPVESAGKPETPMRKLNTAFTVAAAAVSLFFIFDHTFYLGLLGNYELQNTYNYALMALFIPTALLIYPRKKSTAAAAVDTVIAAVALAICVYLAAKGYDILMQGWGASAPRHVIVESAVLWILILEASRRTGGFPLAAVAAVISLYPMFAGSLPGILKGAQFSFDRTVAYHILSSDSALGIPMTVCGEILVGYMIFGVMLMLTGGGDFFLKLSMSLMGGTRGGVAKVAVMASAFFGMLSGSAVSNVVTIGTITIPMMIRTGYRPYFAAAVEACSSNGGQIMPPVMGAVAFVMASFLNMPYVAIALAAAVPALLYYWCIYLQVDGYAVNHNLSGMPRSQLPSIAQTLKEGWYYLFALIFLVVLLAMDMEIQSPYYTSFFLLVISLVKKRRVDFAKVKLFFIKLGEIMGQLVPMLAAVGMIMGSLGMTGVAQAFPSELIRLSGHNLALMLALVALACFVLGMGMTAIAVYVFLAVVVAPAMVDMGLYPVAVHMFLLYWGVLGFITPPVCIAVYPAALIAGAPSMRTGWAAMRLGLTAFIVPFFFVLDPALILHGTPVQVALSVAAAFFGVYLMASAVEGYMIGFGRLRPQTVQGRFCRTFFAAGRVWLFAAGFLVALPGTKSTLAGLVMSAVFILLKSVIEKKARKGALIAG